MPITRSFAKLGLLSSAMGALFLLSACQGALDFNQKANKPVPKKLAEPPELWPHNVLYFNAFLDLNTTRALGFGAGPLTWQAIHEYCMANDFDEEQYDNRNNKPTRTTITRTMTTMMVMTTTTYNSKQYDDDDDGDKKRMAKATKTKKDHE